MPSQVLPKELTKVSYILKKTEKRELKKVADKKGVSMSFLISKGLKRIGVLPKSKVA